MQITSPGKTRLPNQSDTDNLSSSSVSRSRTETKPLDACVICLEPVSERAVAVPCNHCAFDFICIITWVQANSTCPLCKTELSAIQYDWRSPHDYKEYHIVPENLNTPTRASSHFARRSRGVRSRPSRYRPYCLPSSTAGEAVQVNHDLAISRRRYVYRHKLYSLHVGSNRVSCFKDFTPQSFSRSPELQSRARKWIRRELQVFDFLTSSNADFTSPAARHFPQQDQPTSHHGSEMQRGSRNPGRHRTNNAEFILEYIVAILKTADIKGSSGNAQTMLQEFLGEDNARLFLHELGAWLRSPYTALDDWDRHVQYRIKLPGFSNIPNPASPPSVSTCDGQVAAQPDFERFRQSGESARRRYEAD